MPIRVALSAYAGPIPRRVVPICSFPSRRSRAPSSATCHGMIRWALPETKTSPSVRCPRRLELVELVDQHLRVDDAAGADRARDAADDPGRDRPDLVRLAVDDDRVPGIRATLIAADEVGLLGEQVDDLALPLVAPLRADDHGRGHVPHSRMRCGARRRRAAATLRGAHRRVGRLAPAPEPWR